MRLDEARALMHEWVAHPSLRTHMEAVAACMDRCAAEVAPTERERWTVAGLLHDFDYERYPDPADHPRVGVAHLRTLGVDEETLEAILGHADHTGTPRATAMAKHLYAVDELAGFIVACGRVRPDGLDSLDPAGVRKKLRTPSFAAAVSREDIARGIADLGVDEERHLARCIAAIRDAGLVRPKPVAGA